ncbi:integrase catalytic domain-containing protein [Trichonephila clavipes]|nr:integrase catalytic domain-containing protein [Trichonephila clavipes]
MLKSAHCVKPTGEIKEFKIDDAVLINDEKFPRHFWKLGKVVDVFPGRDGKICSCVDGFATEEKPWISLNDSFSSMKIANLFQIDKYFDTLDQKHQKTVA